MGLRIGDMMWNTSDELKDLLEIVNAALEETELQEKYFDQLNRTIRMTKNIHETVEEIGEGLVLVNSHTGETMTIQPGQFLIATTSTMTKWEKKTAEEL
jgi:hypothetical protein